MGRLSILKKWSKDPRRASLLPDVPIPHRITVVAGLALAKDLGFALRGVPEVSVLSSIDGIGAMADVRVCFARIGLDDEALTVPRLSAIMRRNPWTSFVPVVGVDPEPGLLVELGGLEVSGVLTWPDENSPDKWSRRVVESLFTAEADLVGRLTRGADVLVREGLSWAVAHAHKGPRSVDLAHALGKSLRGLRRHLRETVGLSPARLLAAGRLIQASLRLQCTDHSVERVAIDVGFAEASGLRRALARFVDIPPSGLRNTGFLEELLAVLNLRAPTVGESQPATFH